MHKKYLLIIIALCLLTFGNTLNNGFVGDDQVVIVNNDFYKSPENIMRIFKQDYITSDINIAIAIDRDNASGSVAYRPALSLTYFLDYAIWKLNPSGYHFTNVLLHTLNSILVYILVFLLVRNPNYALFAALLFCVHPVKTEAVTNIGYRADALATFYALLSILCYAKYRLKALKYNSLPFILSHVFFILGLFTKEAVIVLPALIIAFDIYFQNEKFQTALKNLFSRYLGFVVIGGTYLAMYLFVFRNAEFGNLGWLAGNAAAHLITMLKIFVGYILNFVFPLSVNILPPQYAPSIDEFWYAESIAGVIIFLLLVFLTVKTFQKSRVVSYFLLWFLIAYIPISNLVPIPNPMAHRFLYFPSVGLLVALALWIAEFCQTKFAKESSWSIITQSTIVVLCIVLTIPLNGLWKNNYTVSRSLIKNYPKHPRGYLIMGLHLSELHLMDQSRFVLEQGLALGLKDPRAYYTLGIAALDEPQKAVMYFVKCINEYPSYALPYTSLGRILLLQGETTKALPYFKKAIQLAPTYAAYGYLIQGYLMTGEKDQAQKVLQHSQTRIRRPEQQSSLQKFLDEAETVELPIDIGF